jgi:hypothetical protein
MKEMWKELKMVLIIYTTLIGGYWAIVALG